MEKFKKSIEREDKYEFARRMKKNPTPSEKLFLETWKVHGKRRIRTQMVLLGFIADFYVRTKQRKLIIEIDGDSHKNKASYDAWRDAIFLSRGYNVLRIPASDVMNDPVGCVERARQYFFNCTVARKLKQIHPRPDWADRPEESVR